METPVDLKKIFSERKKAKTIPLTVSLEITTKSSKTPFINNEVLVNEMDIRHEYDLVAIIKDNIFLHHIDELIYIELTQDTSKSGLYVVKTKLGIEIVVKKYDTEEYVSLKINQENKNIYTKYYFEDFLFIFGKVIN